MFQNKLIKAGAGTGKTYLLSRAYINRLVGFSLFPESGNNKESITSNEHDIEIETISNTAAAATRILAITFTTSAAGEMKSRIIELIIHLLDYINSVKGNSVEQNTTIPPALESDQSTLSIIQNLLDYHKESFMFLENTLSNALADSESMKISTIHSYANSMMMGFLDRLQLDPPRIITDKEINIIYRHILNAIPDQKTKIDKSTFFEFFDLTGKYYGKKLIMQYISNGETRRITKKTYYFLKKYNARQIYRDPSFCKKNLLVYHLASVKAVFPLIDQMKAKLSSLGCKDPEIHGAINNIADSFLQFWNGDSLKFSGASEINFRKSPWNKIDDDLKDDLTIFRDIFNKQMAKNLDCSHLESLPEGGISDEEHFEQLRTAYLQITEFLQQFYDLYLDEMSNNNFIDFDRIIHYAQTISEKKDASRKKSTPLRYILIDEFQDTSRLQWDFLQNIGGPQTKYLIVGDHKQAIYSFQGGDPRIISNLQHEKNEADENKYKSIQLSINYRSSADIINFYNTFFSSLYRSRYSFQGGHKLFYSIKEVDRIKKKVDHSQLYEKVGPSDNSGGKDASIGFFFHFEKKKEKTQTESIYDNKETTSLTKEDFYRALAKFIRKIEKAEITQYAQISEKIKTKKKAIGILMMNSNDSPLLYSFLKDEGVEVSLSRSQSLFETDETKEFFFFLKTWQILFGDPSVSKHNTSDINSTWNENEKYFIAGFLSGHYAGYDDKMISDILVSLDSSKINDAKDTIKNIFEALNIPQILDSINIATASEMIFELFKIHSALSQYHDFRERYRNIENIIQYIHSFTANNGSNINALIDEMEFYLFSADSNYSELNIQPTSLSPPEAPITIGTIHSSKGLEYPMVIIPQLEATFHNQGPNSGIYTETIPNSHLETDDIPLSAFYLEDYKDGGDLFKETVKPLSADRRNSEYLRQFYVAITRAKSHLLFAGRFSEKKLSQPERINADLFKPDNSFAAYFSRITDLFQASSASTWKNKNELKIFETSTESIDLNFNNTFLSSFFLAENYIDFDEKEAVRMQKRDVKKFDSSYRTYTKFNPPALPEYTGFSYQKSWHAKKAGSLFHYINARYFSELSGNKESIVDYYQKQYKLSEDEKDVLSARIEKWMNHELFKQIKESSSFYFELPLETTGDDKRRHKLYIDLLFFNKEEETWELIDFKTTSVKNEKEAKKKTREYSYDEQLNSYEKVLRQLNFTQPLKKGIYYTDIAFIDYVK